MTETVRGTAGTGPATTTGPPWALPRGLIILLGIASLVVAVAGIRAMAWLIGPAFLALIIVIAVTPLQDWMLRRGLPRWLSVLALVVGVYAILLGVALIMIISVARLSGLVPQYAGQADALLKSLEGTLAGFNVSTDELRAALQSVNWGRIAGLVGAMLAGVAGLMSNLVFLLALLLFLSVEANGVGNRLASIAVDRPEIAAALGNFARGTRSYLLVTTVFGLIVAVLDSVALAIMGIPLAVTWGLLSFITNYIPNIGFILGVIPPALIGLLQGGPGLMLTVIVVYSVLNFVVQSLIQPRFIGDSVGLSVTVTFLTLFLWTWLIGPLGAILAIPLTLLAKALLVDVDPGASWADALLRDRPVPRTVPQAAAVPEAVEVTPAPDGAVGQDNAEGVGVDGTRSDRDSTTSGTAPGAQA
jgi:AI-2 transport protein TqsA